MLLEEMIHAYWRDSTLLSSAIPPERFSTGPAPAGTVPRAVLANEKSEVLLRTNRVLPWHKLTFRFELYHDSFETGLEIASLVERSFDRLRLAEPNDGWSYLFRYIGGDDRTTDGVWVFVRRFQLIG